jgi:outer membrane protein TolC
VTSRLDIEGGLRRDTLEDREADARDTAWGYELAITLPILDWGDPQRAGMNARTLAAGHELEAALRGTESRLREAYSSYRTAFGIARHYREEIIPLTRLLGEENVLRYNAMLIGVFELLADAREQIRAVMAGIAAAEQFWLADARLQAVIMGTAADGAISGPAAREEVADAAH